MSTPYFKSSNVGLTEMIVAVLLLSLLACGQARPVQQNKNLAPDTRPTLSGSFPFHKQRQQNDCGVACMKMICDYYHRPYTEEQLTADLKLTREGTSLLDLSETAEQLGFKTVAARVTLDQLTNQIPQPCIIHWGSHHFVVSYTIDSSGIYIADPGDTLRRYDIPSFCKQCYESSTTKQGIVLMFEVKE